MDADQFDGVARAFAGGSRRRLVKALAAGALAALLTDRRGGAAAGRPCADHFDCPGNQLCGIDDATQRVVCQPVGRGQAGHQGPLCKAPTEYTWCPRGAECCVSPALRDPPGYVVLVANCCERGVTACDPERGCVAAA
jgi:hypothetical protein